MNIGILKLPEATAAKTGNLFIVEKPDVTEKISFENLQFGLDNVTFANTVSAHSSQIQYLTTTVYNLSTSLYSNFDFLTDYVNNYFASAFNKLQYSLFPVGSVRTTTTFNNPSNIIAGTTWVLIAQSRFIAGVGNTYSNGGLYVDGDKNKDNVPIAAGDNTSLGEYSNSLAVTELPAHDHEASMFGETDSSIAGQFVESEAGPEQFNIAPVTSDPSGLSSYHNNIKPCFGIYIWQRTV